MVDAKISITTKCNAKCATCPVWEYPGQHMTVENFKYMWIKLMLSEQVHRVLLNNTGDMYIHPDRKEIFQYMADHHYKPIIMTTNAGAMDMIPEAVDQLIISFNGGDKESYEKTTGLNFENTVNRIKKNYHEIEKKHAEIHCLIWEGNKGTEDKLKALWTDFPGRVRISYKYDNQMKEDKTLSEYRRDERIFCDYLNMLSILPDGKVISCAHDFEGVTNFGNILEESVSELIDNRNRKRKKQEHYEGRFTGLCEKCNYNTAIDDKIVYLK